MTDNHFTLNPSASRLQQSKNISKNKGEHSHKTSPRSPLFTQIICPNCNTTKFIYKTSEETKKNKIKNTWLCIKCDTEIYTEKKGE